MVLHRWLEILEYHPDFQKVNEMVCQCIGLAYTAAASVPCMICGVIRT
jgi:hypothetical protein